MNDVQRNDNENLGQWGDAYHGESSTVADTASPVLSARKILARDTIIL